MNTYKACFFDLDGTLAESKSHTTAEMAEALERLATIIPVIVISGGSFEQFQKQFLRSLKETCNKDNIFLMPTSGAQMFRYKNGSWVSEYSSDITPSEAEALIKTLQDAVTESGVDIPETTYGDVIEYRGSQVTFSALGQEAPLEVKKAWDPNTEKRKKIISCVDTKDIANFDLRIGGTTSIDVTRKGIDKAFGVEEMSKRLNIQPKDCLYVGDALFDGGNDSAVKRTGITTIETSGPTQTLDIINKILS